MIDRWSMDGHGCDVKEELDPEGPFVLFTDHERVVAEKDARIKELEGRVEAQRRELSEWVEQDAMWRGMVRRLEATIEEATNE